MSNLTEQQLGIYKEYEEAIKSGSDFPKLMNRVVQKKIVSGDLEQIFSAANTCITFQDEEHTVTLLGLAINSKNEKSIKKVLGFLISGLKNMENTDGTKVLNAKSIKIKLSGGGESTLRALEYAATLGDEYVKSILNVAINSDMLRYVLDALKEAGNQDTLSKYSTNISNVAVNLEPYQLASVNRTLKKEAENQALNGTFDRAIKTIEQIIKQRTTEERIKEEGKTIEEKTIGKAIETDMAIDKKANRIGFVFGVVAALAVGIGCGVGTQLSILAVVGIAVAAAVAVGLVAYGITYAVSKPSSVTDSPNAQPPGYNSQIVS